VTGVTVGRLVRGPAVFVPGEITAEELVERHFLRYPARAFPVLRDRTIVGVVAVGDVSGLSLDERTEASVFDLMAPLEEVPVLREDQPLLEAVQAVRSGGHDRVLVVREAEVLGALTREDVAEWVSRSATRGNTATSTGATA
jgi:CBS domain-containing protein